MAVTENFFTGDGSTTSYVLTFEYIDEDDVKVSLDGSITTAYSFANATTILFDTAPASDVAIRIYRDTDIDELKSTFFAGSSIRAQDLNKNFEQNNFAVQEIKNYTWDNETDTIHSDETWVSSDTQIATTAAMDQRFQDEAAETIESGETWVSDNDHIATTAAIDARFQDELSETITSSETWPNNDDTIATTAAIDDRIDLAITNDIGTDGTGITITDDGDGTITLGLGSGSIDLDRIKAADIVTSAEANPNNDTTIATTAKIDDMIDAAITGDIAVDSTGLTLTDDGDGTITLGIGAGSVDLDRIKADDIITQAEQNADYDLAGDDDSIFTSSAAIRRFENFVQNDAPSGTGIGTGRVWVDVDNDLTLSVWNGSSWLSITSGGTFTEQPNVVYVDGAAGDNANDGHRVSRPKQTIKAAIDQINEEIDVELTSGGSGYVEGSYSTVSLTGGTGTGLTADITVNASGVVSAVTLNSRTPLVDSYYIGDVLSADAADLGGSGSGLQITVTGDGDGQIVVVSAGVYQEVAPIQIKRRNVSVIGQALRSCLVHPTAATETNNLFELNSGSYLAQLTFTGVQAGNDTGNALDPVLPNDQGWNAAFYEGAFITKSPYIQNCTNFSDSEIDNDDLNAHNPAGGAAGDLDSAPTGGGLLIDGSAVQTNSPLRSMVCDSYTHVALNGPGILVTNNGYAQCTSSYAFFNRYHIKCLNGGQANLAASTTDFGDQGLVADGRSTDAIFTAALSTAASDRDITFTIDAPTADASWHGIATRPQSNMLVELNSITYPILSATANGSGWDVTISRPDPADRSSNLGLNGAVATPATASFFLRSQIASSGHTMEYVGSGTNYNALPENGGVPDEADQIIELNNGKVWTAITDHNGKFKIGGNQTTDPIFEVDQQLGFVTIPEGSIAFNLLSDTTPQLGGNLDVLARTITTSTTDGNITLNPNGTGVVDVSTSRITNVTDPTGAQDAATRNYVDNNSINNVVEDLTPQLGGDLDVNGQTITSASNGNIVIDPNGTGIISLGSNVGVGTTTPGSILHIRKDSSNNTPLALDWPAVQSGLFVDNQQTGTTGAFSAVTLRAHNSDSVAQAASIIAQSVGGAGFAPSLLFTQRTGSGVNTERMRIDSSGRVGIGTSSPAKLLEVSSSTDATIRINDPATIGAVDRYIGGIEYYTNDASGGAKVACSIKGYHVNISGDGRLQFATGAETTAMTIDSSQRVGIGTTSPTTALQVVGTGRFSNSTEGLTVYHNGTVGWLETSGDSATPIAFANGGTEKARIDSSGRLLVGTTTAPTDTNNGAHYSKLTSVGNTYSATGDGRLALCTGTSVASLASGSAIGGIYFGDNAGAGFASISASVDATPGTSDYPGRLVFSTTADGASTPTERMRIRNDGDIWMNSSNGSSGTQGIVANSTGLLTVCTTNTTAQIINVNSGSGTRTLITFRTDGTDRGSITSNGSTTSYNTSSDYRLKENVVPLTGAADRVNQLQVRRFNFIADPDTTVDGFIAHEAQAVVPEAVTGTHDELDDEGNPVYQGIDQSKLVPLLTAALQEALAKIETLEQRLNDAGIA